MNQLIWKRTVWLLCKILHQSSSNILHQSSRQSPFPRLKNTWFHPLEVSKNSFKVRALFRAHQFSKNRLLTFWCCILFHTINILDMLSYYSAISHNVTDWFQIGVKRLEYDFISLQTVLDKSGTVWSLSQIFGRISAILNVSTDSLETEFRRVNHSHISPLYGSALSTWPVHSIASSKPLANALNQSLDLQGNQPVH